MILNDVTVQLRLWYSKTQQAIQLLLWLQNSLAGVILYMPTLCIFMQAPFTQPLINFQISLTLRALSILHCVRYFIHLNISNKTPTKVQKVHWKDLSKKTPNKHIKYIQAHMFQKSYLQSFYLCLSWHLTGVDGAEMVCLFVETDKNYNNRMNLILEQIFL